MVRGWLGGEVQRGLEGRRDAGKATGAGTLSSSHIRALLWIWLFLVYPPTSCQASPRPATPHVLLSLPTAAPSHDVPCPHPRSPALPLLSPPLPRPAPPYRALMLPDLTSPPSA